MEHAYGLGVLSPADNDAKNTGWEMKSLLDLSQEEYEECAKACLTLGDYRRDANIFQIVLLNFREVQEVRKALLAAYVEKNFESLSGTPDLNLNRLLLNLLSSIRFYLDYVETNVKQKYGATSTNATKFKKYCSDTVRRQFLLSLSVRFRNYAHH